MNDLWGPETLRISSLTPRLKTYFMSYILSTLPISSQRPYSKKLWPLPMGFPPGAVATGHPKMEWAKRQSQGFPPPGFYASAGRTCLPLASKIDCVAQRQESSESNHCETLRTGLKRKPWLLKIINKGLSVNIPLIHVWSFWHHPAKNWDVTPKNNHFWDVKTSLPKSSSQFFWSNWGLKIGKTPAIYSGSWFSSCFMPTTSDSFLPNQPPPPAAHPWRRSVRKAAVGRHSASAAGNLHSGWGGSETSRNDQNEGIDRVQRYNKIKYG